MGADHPIAWLHTQGGGRFFYTELGHDVRSMECPSGANTSPKPFAGLPENSLRGSLGPKRIASHDPQAIILPCPDGIPPAQAWRS